MYRILAADQPVRERRNQREHPQYTSPSWWPRRRTRPGPGTSPSCWGRPSGRTSTSTSCSTSSAATRSLDGRRPGELGAGRSSHRRDLPQTGRPAPGAHPALRPRAPMTSKCTAQLLADLGVTRSLSRPQVSDDNPFSEAQFKTLKYHPRLPWPLPRHHRRDRLLPNVLPLVQHRTSPWRDRDAHPGRRPSQSNPERAGAARADPSSRLDPSSRTLRSRDPTTASPSPSRLDQPTCDTHNRRNCSVNRNRHCLKVVDRFRAPRSRCAPAWRARPPARRPAADAARGPPPVGR